MSSGRSRAYSPKAVSNQVTRAKAASTKVRATQPAVNKVKPTPSKGTLHSRNLHSGRYDLAGLTKVLPELKQYLKVSPRGEQTINFADDQAVLCLNRALLAHFYQIQHWQIPPGYLCPPIPGRADHIHYISDLLAKLNQGKVPRGNQIKLLDIGTGANCIYPIIASQSYGWQCLASDIDPVSVNTASAIVKSNPVLVGKVEVKLQPNAKHYFKDIIGPNDKISITVCNPPFHSSLERGHQGSQRKWQNLNRDKKGYASVKAKQDKPELNFGGQKAELWCPGGELAFVKGMISESCQFAEQVCWFTSLIAKGEHLRPLKKHLSDVGAEQVEVLPMQQGQKVSRILAWSFLSPEQQQAFLSLTD